MVTAPLSSFINAIHVTKLLVNGQFVRITLESTDSSGPEVVVSEVHSGQRPPEPLLSMSRCLAVNARLQKKL